MDIVEKLTIVADLKLGDPWPEEVFGPEFEGKGWAGAISKLCKEAKEEIEMLRGNLEGALYAYDIR
jgi:hypothetical protein